MVKGDLYELQRCDTSCLTPKEQLFVCVQRNDVVGLNNLVSDYENILDTLYERDRNILLKAISDVNDNLSDEIVRKLIELGVNVYYNNVPDEHMDGLHFAAYLLNPRILNVICEYIKENDTNKINSLCDGGNTALNLIIKKCDHNNRNFMECVRILVENRLNINKSDEKNRTPILWAAHKQNKELVNYLLNQPNVDIDSHKISGQSARQLIEIYQLNEVILPAPVNNNTSVEEQCMKLLNLKLEKDFIETFNINLLINPDYDNQYETFLQNACRNGLIGAVRKLLERKVDINKTGSKNTDAPIQIAAKKGFYEIFHLLLNTDGIIIPKELLHTVLLNLRDDNGSVNNQWKCLEELLTPKHMLSIDLNYTNREGYTPLHYATSSHNSDLILKLLNEGANLAIENNYGVMPIESIDVPTLKKHFDNCIVSVNSSSNLSSGPSSSKSSSKANDCKVSFNFNSLVPKSRVESDMESGGITYSFINEDYYETNVVAYLATNKETRCLMKHPLITSFLLMKWQQFALCFYLNLFFYVFLCFSLYLYIFLDYRPETTNNQNNLSQILSSVFLYVMFILLIVRECFQMYVSFKTYLRDIENYIEASIIISVIIMLSINNSDDYRKNQIFAVVILLSAFELIMLIGQIPALSTYIVMLRTVSWNFFKCLSWYAILIVAFAYSFFILFHDKSVESSEGRKNGTNGENDDEDEEDKSFVDPGIALFKTIVMFTGEFDASSIKFSNSPYMSRIIFIIFVFMIAIVLINLLNGLAVSDIHMIKSDAELYGLIARAEHVNYIEKMFNGNLMPKPVNKLYCFHCVRNDFNILHSLRNKTMLMPYLDDGKLIINLSEWGRIQFGSFVNNCFASNLDRNSIRRTRSILEDKKQDELVQIKENEYKAQLNDIIAEQKVLKELLLQINERLNFKAK